MNSWLHDILNSKEDNYMLPFYWQHGDHHGKIPAQIEEIYKSGCRALCVESRPHKDFCGKTWWEDMDLIISEAEKRGMKVWILDDDHFPTGHAAGAVNNHPELRKWQLVERHVDVAGPLDNALLIVNPENEDNVLLGAYYYERTDKAEEIKPFGTDVKDNIKEGFLHLTIPEGVYRVFFIYKTRGGTSKRDYIDMLREESVKLLIDTVYESHYEHYKEHFGKTVAGFFSDEPCFGNDWYGPHSEDHGFYCRSVGMPGLALPWNERVIDIMKDALGTDPVPFLPALWFDMGEKTGEVRYAYMDAVTKLYRDCFTRQLGDWCEAHGVEYIGHIIEDMNAHARLSASGGHYFRSLDGQHMSGIDIVLHQLIPGLSGHVHSASSFGNNLDPEFFDYVLAKLDSSFARIGTQMNGRAMCEVFGAYGWAEGTPIMKWLLDHLLVRGVNYFVPHAFSPSFPDPDCPPHFGAGGKDPQYEGFSILMNYGNRVSHLLSHGKPVTSVAVLYHADAEWYSGYGNAMFTQVPAKMLYDEHIDFDILPTDCFMPENNSRVFQAEVKNGKIKVGEQIYSCLVVPASDGLPEKVDSALKSIENKGARVIRMEKCCGKSELLERVLAVTERDVCVKGDYPLLRCSHFEYSDSDVFMFVNESVSKPVDTTVKVRTKINTERALILDFLNDSKYTVKVENSEFALKLSPYQSVIAVFDQDESALEGTESYEIPYEEIPADLSFDIETADYTDMNSFKPLCQGATSSDLPEIDPAFSGKIRYTAKFDAADRVCGIDFGNVGQNVHLWCNGKDLGMRVCKPYSFDLSEALHRGSNELTAVVSNTLANAVRDGFSGYLAIPASGITGPVKWIKKL